MAHFSPPKLQGLYFIKDLIKTKKNPCLYAILVVNGPFFAAQTTRIVFYKGFNQDEKKNPCLYAILVVNGPLFAAQTTRIVFYKGFNQDE
jgi:hypothetical protein